VSEIPRSHLHRECHNCEHLESLHHHELRSVNATANQHTQWIEAQREVPTKEGGQKPKLNGTI